jgi:hypothetical protein
VTVKKPLQFTSTVPFGDVAKARALYPELLQQLLAKFGAAHTATLKHPDT